MSKEVMGAQEKNGTYAESLYWEVREKEAH